jgi:hypothetical protein
MREIIGETWFDAIAKDCILESDYGEINPLYHKEHKRGEPCRFIIQSGIDPKCYFVYELRNSKYKFDVTRSYLVALVKAKEFEEE